jgi:hypothetical protein
MELLKQWIQTFSGGKLIHQKTCAASSMPPLYLFTFYFVVNERGMFETPKP